MPQVQYGGANSSQCFIAGTLVLTANGYVPIEEIEAGDRVFAENPETGEKGIRTVVQTFVNETDELVHVTVNGEVITTTPEHPFYVPQKGWTGAIHLRAGDILVLSNGEYVVVEKIEHELLESPALVYNFEVEDFHTYYVSEYGVLVHNACHGNSLQTNKKTDLYVLRDNDTGAVKKIGETTRGIARYTKSYYAKHNVNMHIFDSGSKRAMHFQQHRLLQKYVSIYGKLPSLNKTFW